MVSGLTLKYGSIKNKIMTKKIILLLALIPALWQTVDAQLVPITNGETGLSVRTKLNSLITNFNNGLGANQLYYSTGSAYTSSSNLTFDGSLLSLNSTLALENIRALTDTVKVDSLIQFNESLILTSAGSQDILIKDQQNDLLVQGGTAGTEFKFEILAADNDGTDDVYFEVDALGVEGQGNREDMIIGYDAGLTRFKIMSEANGTGVLRDIAIETEGNAGQIVVNADGKTYLDGNGVADSIAATRGYADAAAGGIINGTTNNGVTTYNSTTGDLDVESALTFNPSQVELDLFRSGFTSSIFNSGGAFTVGSPNGALIVNTGTIQGKPTTGNDFNITASGGADANHDIVLAGKGAGGIIVNGTLTAGTTTSVDYFANLFDPTFTSGGASNQAAAQSFEGSITGASGDITFIAGNNFNASVTTQAVAETIADVAQLYIQEPNVTEGAGSTVTNASTVKIASSPTEGDNNYGLWVASGSSRFDDTIIRKTSTGSGGTANGSLDDVIIDSNGQGGMTVLTPAANTGYYGFGDPGVSYAGGMEYNHSTDQLNFITSASTRVSIDASGNLLDGGVNTIGVTGNRWTNLYTTNQTTTNAETVDSDSTLKANITPITSGTPVDQIGVYSYTWKPVYDSSILINDTSSVHYGVIAQEVETILPNLVKTNPETGKKSVAYTELIPFLIKAIQEQNAKLEELEARIQTLENQ